MHSPTRLIKALALGCAIGLPGTALTEDDPGKQVLIKIDDFSLTTLHLALFASQTGRNPEGADEQIRMLNELANNFMVANSAEGKALAAEPEIAAALEVARARLIAQAYVRNEVSRFKPDEAQVRALYDATYSGGPRKEFKARHILLNSKDAAIAAIKELGKGADFAELATKHSVGPSKTVGGDLGWFEPEQMVPEFSAATEKLADGAYTQEPVKTTFGWHVILREESREVAQPDFETARPELEQQIRQQHVAQLIKQIREKANIEVQRLDASE